MLIYSAKFYFVKNSIDEINKSYYYKSRVLIEYFHNVNLNK